ncbi:hypothetical protein DUNSADRAFT_12677 [Dunaliella salina]|uniref:Uncharacterized protein n=1 Tax=Dunaliella salina TaxID=3046 RepID=A0ABQ7GAU8_DUNSA|nr:hypothetical protein DUNSADRAFT_12677 [Dunaliella salina]KAF5831731.1 hypothetical protein DUNSADRAFT_12677 [Dunaliella salina]|eukprot:KAF5831729.1 hypothetical protein DUNSADRAFT_12677 [Dunaliella salina]
MQQSHHFGRKRGNKHSRQSLSARWMLHWRSAWSSRTHCLSQVVLECNSLVILHRSLALPLPTRTIWRRCWRGLQSSSHDVIIEKHVSHEQGGSKSAKAGSKKYQQLMGSLHDLLQEILEYTKEYRSRNFILKLLQTSNDCKHYQEMVDDLARLIADAHFSVSISTHSMTLEVHEMSAKTQSLMENMVQQIRNQTPYKDRSSEVNRLVEDSGGIDAVLRNPAKIEQVVKHLDYGNQITLDIVRNQVRKLSIFNKIYN